MHFSWVGQIMDDNGYTAANLSAVLRDGMIDHVESQVRMAIRSGLIDDIVERAPAKMAELSGVNDRAGNDLAIVDRWLFQNAPSLDAVIEEVQQKYMRVLIDQVSATPAAIARQRLADAQTARG